MRFSPLADGAIDGILRNEAPEASAETRAAAIAAAQGSPGTALGFVGEKLSKAHALMLRLMREGDPTLVLRGALSEELGGRPSRERMAAALDLARAVLAQDLREASQLRQARIIEAHAALVVLAAQAPTYNFDPGLLAMEIGGLLASAAVPREAGYTRQES